MDNFNELQNGTNTLESGEPAKVHTTKGMVCQTLIEKQVRNYLHTNQLHQFFQHRRYRRHQ